jgi:cation-transporting ATPase E
MRLLPELTGLSAAQVQTRFLKGLGNSQKHITSRTVLTILRANVLTLFNAVVGGAFLALLLIGQYSDALFGLAVLINVTIGIFQEYRSKRALDKLSILGQTPVRVRRDGKSMLVEVEKVVQDDLLELGAGDQLVADAVLLLAEDLELDESMLTGESEPQARLTGEQLLAGSGVLGGRGLAKVNRVGTETYASELVSDARKFSLVSSEIRQSLNRVILWISWALGPIVVLVFISQLIASENTTDAVVRSIASIVSLVPQGLVLITSIAFAIAATKLAKKRVLLQELAAVEGLARVDVVCFDKTGTLTGGSMQFSSAIALVDAATLGKITKTNWRYVVGEFAHQEDANGTMRALREHFVAMSLNVTGGEPFNSKQKWASLKIDGATWKLGAPEMLSSDNHVLNTAAELAGAGNRTLLLVHESSESTAVALICLNEKVRVEARQAFAYFERQGVSIRVMSGDHPETVTSVARQAGLNFEGSGFDALQLPESEAELEQLLQNQLVFGRVTPEQKKRMVAAMQRKGHVVAMIGDGVNDALALKQADLGIAMGSGAAATRAVANLVLLDNHFEVIPSIVAEGRRVIANVERLSRLFLTKTVWALTLAITFSALVWQFPFLPRQLSAVDGFAIGIPAFLLALLPNDDVYKPGFLRRALAFCIPAGLVTAASVIGLAIWIQADRTWSVAEGQTATSILLSATGLWVLGSLVRPWSKITVAILVSMALAAVAMFSLDVTRSFFGFVILDHEKILLTLIVATTAAALLELVNFIAKRLEVHR